MKSLTSGTASHLEQEVTTLATCWEVTRRDGEIFRFTDHDDDVVVESNTYVASSGYIRTAISSNITMSIDNMEMAGFLDSEEISHVDLRNGLFDFAEIKVFAINWANPAQGIIRLRRGWIGEVSLTRDGLFRAELRGVMQALNVPVSDLYQPLCRVDLGSSKCKINLEPALRVNETAYAVGDRVVVVLVGAESPEYAQYGDRVFRCTTAGTTAASAPTFDTVVGNTTTDGTAVWTTEEAWTKAGAVTDVVSRVVLEVSGLTNPTGWFNSALLFFETGNNQGRGLEVKVWDFATERVELFLPFPFTVQVGDKFRIHPGCDKRRETCRDRFANMLNFRGEPDVPGFDALFSYGGPRS